MQRAAESAHAGGVDQAVDPVKGLLRAFGQRRHLAPVGHVAGDRLRLAAGRADLSGCVLEAGQRAPAYDRGGAQAGQLYRGRCPNAAASAGDKGRFSLQSVMHFVSSWIVRRILAANAEYSLNIHYLMERFSAAQCQLIREFWAFLAPAITRARRQNTPETAPG